MTVAAARAGAIAARVVIVGLGLTRRAGAWAQDEFASRILGALAE